MGSTGNGAIPAAKHWLARLNRVAISLFLLCFLLSVSAAWAKPATEGQARRVVENMLALDAQPLGCPLGQQVREVRIFRDDLNNPLYYVVFLNPTGIVIVSGNDLVEPIIGFLSGTYYDPSSANPLGALIGRDLPGRVERVRKLEAQAQGLQFAPVGLERDARRKWVLLAGDAAPAASDLGLTTISDIRVPPLTQSFWDQGNEGSNLCYNYFTPNNWVCGCAATGLAQLMRYHQYPTVGVGARTNKVLIWNTQTNQFDTVELTLRGGDGAGGPYDWNNMVLDPDGNTPDLQRRAIGALTCDAGVSINMHYTPTMGDGILEDKNPLVNFFNYGNTVYATIDYIGTMNIPTLIQMINPNLDAALPVMMRITGTQAHIIVGDGYGYNGSTMYHHLNIGWGGSPASSQNIWYNLPNIGTGDSFNAISSCWYNIYPTGTGEIISGRVVDNDNNNPLSNANVGAYGGGKVYTTQTDSRGIYAFPRLPSNTGFNISAVATGYNPQGLGASTGESVGHGSIQVGNLWEQVIWLSAINLNQALDNFSLAFTTGGQAAWVVDVSPDHYGGSCARSGAINDNQTSWLATTVTGPGTLSFWWAVSSEYNHDFLEFYLDNSLLQKRSGNTAWGQQDIFIPVGVHAVKWVYAKDDSNSANNDCGYVDKVVWTPGQTPVVSLPPLLAFFPFEGNAKDFSGNNRHGTVYGATPSFYGLEGQCYSFNGATDYITVPMDINPGKHPKLTMGAWVKASDITPRKVVLTHDNGGYDRTLCIDERGGGNGWSAFCGSGQVLGYQPVTADKWTFLAVVYDQAAQNIKLYVDGNPVGSKTGTLGEGLNYLIIGTHPTAPDYFKGVIDNVFVFDGALTALQIAFIRNGGASAILTATKRPNPALLLLLGD